MGKYTSQFVDTNEKLYTVDLEGASIKGTKEFTLGANPFVTEMNSDDETVYSPIKAQSATVTMVTDDYPFDLYASTLQGRKCTLYSGTESNPRQKVEWCGYVTPCMFDMGFNTHLEEIEIECVDGISMLKDLPYRKQGSEYQLLSFGAYVRRILNSCECYKYLYVSDNVQMTQNGASPILDQLYITEQNFFDEKDDMNTLDDDVAWSSYDVLLEICRYMGYTLMAKGDEVFMVDYDAIKKGVNTYHKYTLSNNSTPTRVTLNETVHIDETSYAESSSTLSLDEVYNKVSVKDEFYTFEEIFPNLDDEKFEENITRCLETDDNFTNGKDIAMSYYYNNNDGYKNFPYDNFHRVSKSGKDKSFQIFICKGWRKKLWIVIAQIKKNPSIKTYKYSSVNLDNTNYYDARRQSWAEVMSLKGATNYRIWHKEISSSDYNKWRVNYPSDWWAQSEDVRYNAWLKLMNYQDPSSKQLSSYILLKNGSGTHIQRDDVYKFPFLKLTTEGSGAAFGGEGTYLIIQGSVLYHDEQNTPMPLSDGADNDNLKRKKDCKRGQEMYLPCRLKWGNLYWQGDGWSSAESKFPLMFGIPNQGRHYNRDHYANKHIYDKFVEFIDTAQSQYNCPEKGVYIPTPEDENLEGGIEFTIYANRDMMGDSYHGHWDGTGRYPSYVYVLKGFKIKACVDNGVLDDMDNDSDTVYTNIISNGAVQEMDEITFKICTYDQKKPNYSSVYYMENDKSKYVTTLFNKALYSLQNSTTTTEGSDVQGLKQEEHLVFKMVNQYETPRKILEATLNDNDFKPYTKFTDKTLDGTYIIQEMAHNFRYNSVTLKLIEKQ